MAAKRAHASPSIVPAPITAPKKRRKPEEVAREKEEKEDRLIAAPPAGVQLWPQPATNLSMAFDMSLHELLRLRGVVDTPYGLCYVPQQDEVAKGAHLQYVLSQGLGHQHVLAQLQIAQQTIAAQAADVNAARAALAQANASAASLQQGRASWEEVLHRNAEQQVQQAQAVAGQQVQLLEQAKALLREAQEGRAAVQAQVEALRAAEDAADAPSAAEIEKLRAAAKSQAAKLETEEGKRKAANTERSELNRRLNKRDAKLAKLEKRVKVSEET